MDEPSKKKYDYFICYCGKDLYGEGGTESGNNWEFAVELCKELEKFGKNVYFAPKVGQGDTFKDKSFLKKIIDEVKTFIVLLSPSFFQDFDPENESRPTNCSVIQTEMGLALDHVRSIGESEKYLQYIFLPRFKWCNLYRFCMKKCYNLSEEEAIKYIDISAYNNSTMIEEEPKRAAKEFLKNNLGIDVDRNEEIDSYRSEVVRCFHSMMEHMGRGERFKPDGRSVDLLKKLGVEAESKGHFANWPVFFSEEISSRESETFEASTCAMCFGVLQILHWCETDHRDRKDQDIDLREYYQSTEDYFKTICRDTLVQIVLMRVNENKTEDHWPVVKDFKTGRWKDCEEADKGLNQTTLCAATLLKSGFLREESAYWGKPSLGECAERYSFLSQSVVWVLRQKKSKKDETGCTYCFWGATDVNDSTFLTAVSLDLLLKFAEDAYAKQHKGEAFCNAIKTIPEILTYFEMASDRGGVVSALDGPVSFSHTAKVMNTLCTLCAERKQLSFGEFEIDTDTLVSRAKKIIDTCFRYLTKELNSQPPIYKWEKSRHTYDFFIRCVLDRNIEYYELNGELLAVTAMTKLLDDAAWHCDIEIQDKDVLITKLIEFFEGYRGEKGRLKRYFDWTASESVLVRGRRTCEDEQYPIYALYYYRMALVELLNLLEKSKKTSFEPIQEELRKAS